MIRVPQCQIETCMQNICSLRSCQKFPHWRKGVETKCGPSFQGKLYGECVPRTARSFPRSDMHPCGPCFQFFQRDASLVLISRRVLPAPFASDVAQERGISRFEEAGRHRRKTQGYPCCRGSYFGLCLFDKISPETIGRISASRESRRDARQESDIPGSTTGKRELNG